MGRVVYTTMTQLLDVNSNPVQSLGNAWGYVVFALPAISLRVKRVTMQWKVTLPTNVAVLDGVSEEWLIPYFVGANNLSLVALRMRLTQGAASLIAVGGADMDIAVYPGVSSIQFQIVVPDYATLDFANRAVLEYEVG